MRNYDEYVSKYTYYGKFICHECKLNMSLLNVAYWTDLNYKCPNCFKTVEYHTKPREEILVLSDKKYKFEKVMFFVLDGLYIAGVQKHCLLMANWFKSQGFYVGFILTEGGGLWADEFLIASDIIIMPTQANKITWEMLKDYVDNTLLSNIMFIYANLVKPIEWSVNNIPEKITIYGNLHSEPSEHEVINQQQMQKIISRLNKIFFPSSETKKAYLALNNDLQNEKFIVLPNKLPMIHIENNTVKHNALRILVVSRIDADKFSKQLFIETIKKVTEKIDVEVKVAGNGELFEQLKVEVFTCGLKCIELLGFVLNVDDLYRWCDIVFLPSKRESMPYVMLEAYQNNKAIVMPRVGYVNQDRLEYNNVYTFKLGSVDEAANLLINSSKSMYRSNPTFTQQALFDELLKESFNLFEEIE